MYARVATSPWFGWGASRPPETSEGSQAGSEHVATPGGSATRFTRPVAPPKGGPIAWRFVPDPVAEIVELDPVQVLPFESTVMIPCTVEVPTVTWEPPSTLSGTHPVGSRTHNAGGLPGLPEGRTVADRDVVVPVDPKILENMLLSWVVTMTRMR